MDWNGELDDFTAHALKTIENNKSKPFFLCLQFNLSDLFLTILQLAGIAPPGNIELMGIHSPATWAAGWPHANANESLRSTATSAFCVRGLTRCIAPAASSTFREIRMKNEILPGAALGD
ncbi:MAG: hypothetical protein CMO80_14440 [Verrucomicrobiales bacterium]|nr:hypothetical protein [Verrucomicrobiales bacterium]|tara:strand:+ start:1155 stop:1514 length:360 start_codon:yes stop_codon:yes gene_type:complete